mgnify:CR=1 FL=1
MFENNFSDYFEFQIIGVGKSQYSSSTDNFINDRILPFVEDLSPEHITWAEWDVNQRDLIFLDKNGDYFCKTNLTSSFEEEDILEKIQHLIWNSTADINTEIEIIDQNPLIPSTDHNLLMTITNLSFFDSHYTGYTLSSNSNFIEFSNDMNWFYVLFLNEPYEDLNGNDIWDGDIYNDSNSNCQYDIGEQLISDLNNNNIYDIEPFDDLNCDGSGPYNTNFDNTSFFISDDAPIGEEITLFIEPNLMNCIEDCEECEVDCLECTIGGESEISFIVGDTQLWGDLNNDHSINVLDVVFLVNIILIQEYNDSADLNFDGSLDVLDVVLLVNIIIN